MQDLEAILNSLGGSDDRAASIQDQFDEKLQEFVERTRRFSAVSLIEAARMAVLPWMREDEYHVDPDASAAHVELLALIALSAEAQAGGPPTGPAPEVQEMSELISRAKEDLDLLFNLSHLRAAMTADRSDKLAFISLLARGSQVLIRNTSYADMAERTVTDLLDGVASVREELVSGLGFDAHDAIRVLAAVHKIQQDQVNDRGATFAEAVNSLREAAVSATESSDEAAEHSEELKAQLRASWLEAVGDFFEPNQEASTVPVAEVVAETGLEELRVRAVVERFTVDISGQTPADVVEAFTAGDNPLRPRPFIAADGDRVLLPHHTLSADAVKENLEEYLKTTDLWEAYQQHRGDLVEARVHAALERVLPASAVFRDAFHYFVPANQAEEQEGDPAKYTKRVEGDHLVVVDDVALVVEDKAGAVSAVAKAGKTQRLRTDLTSIITKAADQARRLGALIERDGGVRTDDGWVDLSEIREIHTVAVSLDDLMSVTTATAELVRAGLVDPANIPWTVSLHDLELISELVDKPAEFLLYLRRRRDPLTTRIFMAPDELDLFLLFFDGMLWAEPDPEEVQRTFPFTGHPTPAARRRFREQRVAFVTSRTDQLDAWHYSKNRPGGPIVPKPTMIDSPAGPLIDEVMKRGVFGALSLGATLLSGSTAFQEQIATQANILLDNPHPGRSRQVAVPITQMTNAADGWLLVWSTHPTGAVDLAATIADQERYLRLKKHQLGLPRGALFVFDQKSRELVHVSYDGNAGELPDELKPLLDRLRPPEAFQNRPPPSAKRPPKKRRRRD
ncbi:preprotein translocase subunit SecA [Nocardioides marmorisolisilvae]|uniref:Preprotein translocase subunit SecA n=2 Tax=Nocardioides marmorisolisilvae TaxID=1542737 RepID=A0A3N0DY22_9ACTN|nr:preprotein translocase subunit SecA [Nocardioides marmorisolisilvae]